MTTISFAVRLRDDSLWSRSATISRLSCGDIALIDPRLPYRGVFSYSSRMLVLKLPRLPLERRVGETLTMTAYHIARFGARQALHLRYCRSCPIIQTG